MTLKNFKDKIKKNKYLIALFYKNNYYIEDKRYEKKLIEHKDIKLTEIDKSKILGGKAAENAFKITIKKK